MSYLKLILMPGNVSAGHLALTIKNGTHKNL